MAEVIVFPKAKVTKETKKALEVQNKKIGVEAKLNLFIGDKNWDTYTLLADDLEILAIYGETMKFNPMVSARLISKLAEFIVRMSATLNEMEEPY